MLVFSCTYNLTLIQNLKQTNSVLLRSCITEAWHRQVSLEQLLGVVLLFDLYFPPHTGVLNFASRLSRRSFPVLASVRQRGLSSGRWHQAVGLGVALCAVPVVEVPPAPLSLQQFNTQTHLCGLVFPLGLHPLGELGCAASQRGSSSPLCLTGIRQDGDGKVTEVSCVAAAELRVPQQ